MKALYILPLALLFASCEKEEPTPPAPVVPVFVDNSTRNFTVSSNVPLCVADPLVRVQISEGTYSGYVLCNDSIYRGYVERGASVTVLAIADSLNPSVSVHFAQTKDGVVVFDTIYTVTDTVSTNVFNYGVPL